MTGDIDIVDAWIYPKYSTAEAATAPPGFDIKVKFKLKNIGYLFDRLAWWEIWDGSTLLYFGTKDLDKRDTSGLFTRYILMGSLPITIKIVAGYYGVALGNKVESDTAGFRKILSVPDPVIPPVSVVPTEGYIDVSAKTAGGTPIVGAKIYCDGIDTGKRTGNSIKKSVGVHSIHVVKSGYLPATPTPVTIGPPIYRTPIVFTLVAPTVPKFCYPSISSFSVPDKIALTIPTLGLPTIDLTSFPVKFNMSGGSDCQFPIGISLFVGDYETKTSAKKGSNSIDLISTVKSVLAMKSVSDLKALRGIAISLNYPTKIKYSSPGTVESDTTVHAYTHLTVEDLGDITIPDVVPDVIPDVVPDVVPDVIPDVIPDVVPDVIPDTTPKCSLTAAEYYECPDGTLIPLYECIKGIKVPITAPTCPTLVAPSVRQKKMVYIVVPQVTRVGKKVQIAGMVYCNSEKVGGEQAWITRDGELLTTVYTSGGSVSATWTPIEPGIYNIAITVPESSTCRSSGSASANIQVVRELSAPEIEAAEEEFEKAKERIGAIGELERI